jgi:copper(I)-binding protein
VFDALIRRGRRGAVALAAVAALTPVAAGCAAGADAQTNKPFSATEGTDARISSMKLRDTFILGPAPGAQVKPGDLAPLYVTLSNDGTAGDRLQSISTDGTFGAAKISGGGIDVAPGKAIRTGQHPAVTLGKLAKPLNGGEFVKVTFTFAHAGALQVDVPVLVRDTYFATYPPAPKPRASQPQAKKGQHPHKPGATATPGATQTP